MKRYPRRAFFWILACLGMLSAPSALHAEMHREGEWPADDSELVSLSIEGPRAEAVRKLAEAAGWSVLIRGAKPDTVNLQVKEQPAAKVLELLLADGDYVAKRDGRMIAISARPATRVEEAPPALPNLPSPPPAAASSHGKSHRGEDRVVTGQSITLGRDETVGNLTVLGGSAKVYGTVTDDVAVFGGSLQLHEGSHVYGDIAVMGGSVRVARGAQVDGDVSSLGGSVRREDEAGSGKTGISLPAGGEDRADDSASDEGKRSPLARLARELSSAIARAALLFAFGTVLLALATPRMEVLQHELEARPMRAFAMGIVGSLAGAIALVALCVTIVGIPIAIVAVLVGALGVYAGICAAFTVLGAVLLQGRTQSPYTHLALGCALYFVIGAIPVIGSFVTGAAVLVGLGVLVSTRAAGLLVRREPPPPAAGVLSSNA